MSSHVHTPRGKDTANKTSGGTTQPHVTAAPPAPRPVREPTIRLGWSPTAWRRR